MCTEGGETLTRGMRPAAPPRRNTTERRRSMTHAHSAFPQYDSLLDLNQPRRLAMPRWLLIAAAVLMFSANGWADEPFKKSSALTITNDPDTNAWTVLCDASVDGVDGKQSYSGRMLF